jgi:hypothetical protein
MARWQGHSAPRVRRGPHRGPGPAGLGGRFRVAANELREAHRALVALGVRDRESASEFWTSLPTKGDGTTP